MKDKQKTLGLDFDGTICQKQSYGDGLIYQTPTDGAVEAIKKLKDAGYKLVVFTTRLNPDFGGDIVWKHKQIVEWLQKYGIPYDEVTNHKPEAMAYIDDRAVRFQGNWLSITNYFIQ
jgi:phosphoglycolate phosphatase-like HAD superfamily hydrolase